MSTAWEPYLSGSSSLRNEVNTIRQKATNIIWRPLNEYEYDDAPRVTFVDVYTELANGGTGPVYRMFANGAVDKGAEVGTSEKRVDQAARSAAAKMIADLASSLNGAVINNNASANLAEEDNRSLDAAGYRYLSNHAKAVADILRGLADSL